MVMVLAPRRRLVWLVAFNILSIVAIAAIFWWEDVRYSLPTPRPAHVQAVAPAEELDLPAQVPLAADAPTLLHFFNHRCSCSRFNATHLHALVAQFGPAVHFVAVAEGVATQEEAAATARAIGITIQTIADPDGAIAHAAGVWSTPQAAIVSPESVLLFRGNYNTSRYHTERRTEFVRLALENITHTRSRSPMLDSLDALIAWGCRLPADEEMP
jgi:hypothetical protein